MSWKPGDRLRHRFNPDLGPGLIDTIEGRTLVVHFPESDTSLRISASSDAILPLEFVAGSRALMRDGGEAVFVAEAVDDGRVRLTDGRVVDAQSLWPVATGDALAEKLAAGEVDALDAFSLRLEALHLAAIREADGLGSFLGGRIRLFPHQLYTAERATRADPVRWLLADEVGLGKTVEACLVLDHLLRTGRAERTLVVAPDTLTVQWLGELWRKYHQVFVLLDEKRLVDVEHVYGAGFNPFEAHRQVVVGLEFLTERRKLIEQAVEAGIDLLIVDEAHHLRRPPGHPGNAAYRAIRPLATFGRHVLLLTATPLDDDAHGFFRLLQLLRPDVFPDECDLDRRLESGEPLPPCTSATRRVDIGGLPPREARPMEIPEREWSTRLELERMLRALPAGNAAQEKRKAQLIRRGLASGDALAAFLDESSDATLLELARRSDRVDPRLSWLAEHARQWHLDGDKTLVFVERRETLEWIRASLSRRAQIRSGVFHEDLSAGQRDIEVAQFRLNSGPSILISTECGGEGRNFEFCTRVVLFDLPWNPITVEQRIGRLDRIGRQGAVEIVYPRPPRGLESDLIALYEQLGLFRRPLGGLDRELAGVETAVEAMALGDGDSLPDLEGWVERARAAFRRIDEAAYHELHRDPYRPELASAMLERVPPGLEELTRDVIVAAAEEFGLGVEEYRNGDRHSFELGTGTRVRSLPGVPGGSSYLGSFFRREAVADESIDYFASGHPLVEGLLAQLQESSRGRVALIQRAGNGESGFGLLAIYKDGPQFEAVAIDADGRERPRWAQALTQRPLRSRRIKAESWTAQPGWPMWVRSLARRLEGRGEPLLLAAFRLD